MNYEYKNKAELEVILCDEPRTLYSNEVETKKVVIRIEKCQDKDCVFEGDYLEYTIKICNDSTVVVNEPIFCDDIPEGLAYVPGSFCVEGKQEAPTQYGGRLTFKLKKLTPHSETLIVFKVKVE